MASLDLTSRNGSLEIHIWHLPLIRSLRKIDNPAILSLIGRTPLLEITRFDTGVCQLFIKLETQNPTGSIKDRMALAMVEAAEQHGDLKPGGTIIQATP